MQKLLFRISRRIGGIHVSVSDLQRLFRFAANPVLSAGVGLEIAQEKVKEVLDSGLFGGVIFFPFGEEAMNRIPEFIGSVRRPLFPCGRWLRVVRE